MEGSGGLTNTQNQQDVVCVWRWLRYVVQVVQQQTPLFNQAKDCCSKSHRHPHCVCSCSESTNYIKDLNSFEWMMKSKIRDIMILTFIKTQFSVFWLNNKHPMDLLFEINLKLSTEGVILEILTTIHTFLLWITFLKYLQFCSICLNIWINGLKPKIL